MREKESNGTYDSSNIPLSKSSEIGSLASSLLLDIAKSYYLNPKLLLYGLLKL